ncbi:MAG: hypothetical protein A2Z42_01430 [Candidatus Woykebacteria bacterium RBG_19FT_COMBO_43_10]|uniref:GH18 domain-containing protein n=1 Tax=Candidatus Woykebacteria bacterium RBG_19FT_COMBO_43_10 TaxID=1802598 RepID=A0A1G1WFQ3_9BACT|nr:MAG: hypothetical protein A2Z42_01430 [Candidatus Woykebacteria bacterium RBG_19FT_COMBO_43_10]
MSSKLFSSKNLIILLLAILVVTVATYVFIISPKSQTAKLDMPTPKPDHKLSYVGSIGIGKDKVQPGIASFRENYQELDELTLYWYNLDSDNRISLDDSVSEEMEKDTVAFAKQNKKKVLFGISDHGEAEKADNILDDGDTQKEHISKIISILDEKGYDGVIIDYEDLRENQEEDFTRYMGKLSEQAHSRGKILGISAPIEIKGRVFHGINIVDVSKVVDKMHLNAYEEFGDETGPGPIASIAWVNAVIKNAIDQGVEPNKIILGTAHSGHDWTTKPNKEFFKDTTTKEVLGLLSEYSANLKWDENSRSTFFEYKDDDGKNHTVWLEDYRSFEAKINLAKAYELQGIFIWYLGGEDTKVWDVLREN